MLMMMVVNHNILTFCLEEVAAERTFSYDFMYISCTYYTYIVHTYYQQIIKKKFQYVFNILGKQISSPQNLAFNISSAHEGFNICLYVHIKHILNYTEMMAIT